MKTLIVIICRGGDLKQEATIQCVRFHASPGTRESSNLVTIHAMDSNNDTIAVITNVDRAFFKDTVEFKAPMKSS